MIVNEKIMLIVEIMIEDQKSMGRIIEVVQLKEPKRGTKQKINQLIKIIDIRRPKIYLRIKEMKKRLI